MIIDNIRNFLKTGSARRSSIFFGDLGGETCPIAGFSRLSENPEVQTCVHVIADFVSDMTIHLMQNTEQGDVRIQNELAKKIDIHPSLGMTRKQFIYWIVKTMLTEGNAVVYPSYTKEGLIDNLEPIPREVTFHKRPNGSYEIHKGARVYPADTVLHFVFNPDLDEPFRGRGFTLELREAVRNLLQASYTRRDFLTHQFKPSIIVGVAGLSGKLNSMEGRQEIIDKYLKETKAGQPWVVPEGVINVHQLKPLTLQDLAINDNIVLDKRTVSGLFGVPAYYLGVGEFNETEHNSFIRTRIMSIAQIIEQTLTGLIHSPIMYFRMNPRSLYSYSLEELSAVGGNLKAMGVMTGNEVRDWIGLSPKPGLDEITILENYIPIDKIGDQLKLKNMKKKEVE